MTLIRVADGPAVVVCTTCRHARDVATDARGLSGGARLAAELHAAKAGNAAYAGVAVQEMPCLFACGDPCTVYLRAAGRIGYILGRFTPDADAAREILDYAALHAGSEEGKVPYPLWPDGVKGHFLTRIPPEGFVAR